MGGNFEEAAVRLVRRFAELLREDSELRDSLRGVAASLLDLAQDAPDDAPAKPKPEPEAPKEPPKPDPELEAALEGLQNAFVKTALSSTAAAYSEPVYSTKDSESRDERGAKPAPVASNADTLGRVKVVCFLKLEATHWAVERLRRLETGHNTDEIESNTQELFSKANNIENCFLWMLGTFNPTPDTTDRWVLLAECFGCLGRAVELLELLLPEKEEEQEQLESALDLAAEAQSALRVAVTEVGQGYDPTQVEFYKWLRTFAADRHIYLPRYMRQNDLADPENHHDLQERIDTLEAEVESHRGHNKKVGSLLNKARYHAQKVQSANPEDALNDWLTLAESVEQTINFGLQPSDKKLREILLPIVEQLPDLPEELPKFNLALREVDRYLAMTPSAASTPAAAEPSGDVARVRKLLAGKSIVIIGGESRPQSERAMEEAFEVASVKWVPGAHHQSIEGFKPHIMREDVAVVCLLIRWSSHGFGEIKSFCDAHDKPLVRLPGGYAPNQVAYQILEQIGERLEA